MTTHLTKILPGLGALALLSVPMHIRAAEGPFFITYTHQMEEPGNLEFAIKSVTGNPDGHSRFGAAAAEFEYGLKGWWTTELYLDGQTTTHDSALFTGFRWENRFRLLRREHWVNPVFYVEFEDINGADKTLLEVVDNDGKADLIGSNAESRKEKKREIEAKLILSSYFKGWTLAENFIAEKNVAHAPYEFGYAVGLSRPLALAARPERCEFCRENFQAGVEVYGGLGTHASFGLRDTSHYVAPTVAWTLSNGTSFRLSPGFGVTGESSRFLLRVSVSYELHNPFRRGHAAPGPSVAEAGAKLYDRECASCHGANRSGLGKAPPLNTPDVTKASPEALLSILLNGRLHRGMPSFAHLPEAERRQIVTYLQSMATR